MPRASRNTLDYSCLVLQPICRFCLRNCRFSIAFEAAAKAGFKAVEYLFPYDFAADELAERLKSASLEQALFNLPPGDWEKGERGLAAIPWARG